MAAHPSPTLTHADLDALRRTLDRPDATWRNPVLNLPTTLRELLNWKFRGHIRSRFDEEALVRDYQAAIKTLGDNVRAQVKPLISQLNDALISRERETEKIHESAKELLEALASPPICAAAWDDHISAICDNNGDVEGITASLRHFLGIAGECGHETSNLGICSTLVHILDRQEKLIEHSYEQLGWDFTPGSTYTPDEQLTLCREILCQPNNVAENIVWLTYVRAQASENTWTVAQFTFYKAAWVAEACATRNADFPLLPPEVQLSTEYFTHYPDEDSCGEAVLVRVDMAGTPSANCIAIAMRNVDAVIAAAGGQRRSDWSFFNGTHFMEGDFAGSTGRRPDFLRDLDASRSDSTAYLMSRKGGQWFGTHFDARPDLIRTLDLSGNIATLDTRQASKAPTLTAQLLEHLNTLAETGAPWWEFVDDTFEMGWVWSDLIQDIIRSIECVTHDSDVHEWLRSGIEQGTLADLLANAPDRRAGYGDLHALAHYALALLRLLNRRWLPARALARAIHILSNDQTTRTNAILRYQQEFQVRAARLVRYRNSATHGIEVDQLGAESVFEFAQKLADAGRSIHLASVTQKRSLADLIGKHVATSSDKLRDAENDNFPTELWW